MAQLKLTQIKIDGGTQSRAALNEAVVAEYAEAIEAGAKLPPIVVFFDGSAHWLADGFHRFHAHRKAGSSSIATETRTGTKRDAILFSVGANHDHGLRRTNEDKRRAVRTLLEDAEWSAWTDRQIAEAVGVSHTFVAAVRAPEAKARQSAHREASAARKVESDSTPIRDKPAPDVESDSTPPLPVPVVLAPVLVTATPIKPVKGAPTLESLQAENATLRDELEAARENARELADNLESYMACEEGIEAAAKALAKEKGIRRTVETQRDQWMTKANEAIRTIKQRDRQIAALTRKAAA